MFRENSPTIEVSFQGVYEFEKNTATGFYLNKIILIFRGDSGINKSQDTKRNNNVRCSIDFKEKSGKKETVISLWSENRGNIFKDFFNLSVTEKNLLFNPLTNNYKQLLVDVIEKTNNMQLKFYEESQPVHIAEKNIVLKANAITRTLSYFIENTKQITSDVLIKINQDADEIVKNISTVDNDIDILIKKIENSESDQFLKKSFLSHLNEMENQIQTILIDMKEAAVLTSMDYNYILKKISDIISYITDENEKEILNIILNDICQFFIGKIDQKDPSRFYPFMFHLLNLFSYLEKCSQMKLLNVNNMKNLSSQLMVLIEEDVIYDKMASIKNIINKLIKLDLLTQENIDAVFSNERFSKSCDARLNQGQGLEEVANNDKQNMWGYYCVGIESKIVNFLREGKPLRYIFDYAREQRKNMAILEEHDHANDFGLLRSKPSMDVYTITTGISICDPKIFESIRLVQEEAFDKNKKKYTKKYDNDFGLEKYTTQFSNVSDICMLPKVTHNLYKDVDNNLIMVNPSFSPLTEDEIYESLDKLDNTFLKNMSKDTKNIEEFLFNVGKFSFHLAYLYPTARGTGAIMQWIIRSTIKNYTGIELGDINLGSKKDIPYDIYAHLVNDPNVYANDFKKVLLPKFQDVPDIRTETYKKINF